MDPPAPDGDEWVAVEDQEGANPPQGPLIVNGTGEADREPEGNDVTIGDHGVRRRVLRPGPLEEADNGSGESGGEFSIWTAEEAASIAASQLGTSACGATAVLNVILALVAGGGGGEAAGAVDRAVLDRLSAIDAAQVEAATDTRLRKYDAPAVPYLRSRYDAGTTHDDLLVAMDRLCGADVVGRFFPMYPARDFDLAAWLYTWMSAGAVGVATLNIQAMFPAADAWHHQSSAAFSSVGCFPPVAIPFSAWFHCFFSPPTHTHPPPQPRRFSLALTLPGQ